MDCNLVIYSEPKRKYTQYVVICNRHNKIGKYRNPDIAEMSARLHVIMGEQEWA